MRKIHNYKREEVRDALHPAASTCGANHDPVVTNQNTSFAFSTPTPHPQLQSQALFSPNLHIHTITGSQDLFSQDQISAANDNVDPKDPAGNIDISQEDHEDEEISDNEESIDASLSDGEEGSHNINLASAGVSNTGRAEVLSRTLPGIPPGADPTSTYLKILNGI